jgi:hypothetical protein
MLGKTEGTGKEFDVFCTWKEEYLWLWIDSVQIVRALWSNNINPRPCTKSAIAGFTSAD